MSRLVSATLLLATLVAGSLPLLPCGCLFAFAPAGDPDDVPLPPETCDCCTSDPVEATDRAAVDGASAPRDGQRRLPRCCLPREHRTVDGRETEANAVHPSAIAPSATAALAGATDLDGAPDQRPRPERSPPTAVRLSRLQVYRL